MKIRKKAAITIIIIIVFGIGLTLFCSWFNSGTLSYMANWGVDFPRGIKVEYKTSDIGGMGDGEKYTVFRTRGVDEEFLSGFSSQKNREFENKVNRVAVEWLNVSEEWLPNWDQNYQWKLLEEHSNYLCMLYYPDTQILILAAWYQ